jgi:hypothetical protein
VSVLCKAYTSHEQAARAVEDLLGAGVPGASIRVVSGEPERDAREAPVGGFAGPAGAAGDFAGHEHAQGETAGSFAAGDERGGSFADADRETVTSYPGGVAHMRVAGHRGVHRLLMEAGLDDATARRDLEALHAGRVLVLYPDSVPGEL